MKKNAAITKQATPSTTFNIKPYCVKVKPLYSVSSTQKGFESLYVAVKIPKTKKTGTKTHDLIDNLGIPHTP